jgi:ParB-like chromosome segregation protein Spo0J
MVMRAIDTEGFQRPPANDPGPEPRQEWLPVDRLVVDPEYQRDIRADGRKSIERIAAAFEWTKFSSVVVAPCSLDRFAIIDGMHRVTAAKLVGITRVPCLIQSLDRAGQARAFAAINGSVTKVTPWALYKAALAAGEGWAVTAHRTCKNAGCRLMTGNASGAAKLPGQIYAIGMVRDLVERHGEATVTLALGAYHKSVYGDLAIAWTSPLLMAWISAVANVEGAAARSVEQLAAFHDGFDVLEHDDQVQQLVREAKRRGEKPAARWQLLSHRIAEALQEALLSRAA